MEGITIIMGRKVSSDQIEIGKNLIIPLGILVTLHVAVHSKLLHLVVVLVTLLPF